MSDGLSPKARAFLRSVERGDEPTRADFERVHAGLMDKVAAGIAGGMAALVTAKAAEAASVNATTNATTAVAMTAAGTNAAATGTTGGVSGIAATTAAASVASPVAVAAGGAGTALVAKVVAAAILVVGTGAFGTTAVVRHLRSNELARPPTTLADEVGKPGASGRGVRAPEDPRPSPTATAPEPHLPTTPSKTMPSPAGAASPVRLPTPHRTIARTQGATATAPATGAANPSPPPSPLDVEIGLLRDARAALHAGDAARALSLLDRHDELYSAGALDEDAAAERIYALCALGQSLQARSLADRFLATHPSSPHAASVRASCDAN